MEQDRILFELIKKIIGEDRYYKNELFRIERISDLLAVQFIEDYHCVSNTDEFSFSICKVTGQDKYLFFDYSRETPNYKSCTIEEAINILNNFKK